MFIEQLKELRWKTYDGRILTFAEMDDNHLVNVLYHLQYYQESLQKDISYISWVMTLHEILKEVEKRKLTKEFVKGAPYPFQDKQGNTITWNYSCNRPIINTGNLFNSVPVNEIALPDFLKDSKVLRCFKKLLVFLKK